MCDPDNGWKIGLLNGLFVYFYAAGVSNPTSAVSNQISSCGELIDDVDFGAVFAGATGGTVQLSY
jgi:hypothetical protein